MAALPDNIQDDDDDQADDNDANANANNDDGDLSSLHSCDREGS